MRARGQINFITNTVDAVDPHVATIRLFLRRAIMISGDENMDYERENRLAFALLIADLMQRLGCKDGKLILGIKDAITKDKKQFPSADTIARAIRTAREKGIEAEVFSFDDYYGGEVWARRRANYYMNHERVCQMDRSHPGQINLHHNTYERVGGDEMDEDLISLCRQCHAKHHNVMA